MTTTAHYRKLAADHEAHCEWTCAARAWAKAIELYPASREGSALAKLDIDRMTARLDACRVSARS